MKFGKIKCRLFLGFRRGGDGETGCGGNRQNEHLALLGKREHPQIGRGGPEVAWDKIALEVT